MKMISFLSFNGFMRAISGKKRIVGVAAFVISLFAFLATAWIILPSPSYYIWLFSVLASEWSLGFGILATFSMLLSLFTKSRVKFLTFSFGFAAVAISLYPLASAFSAQRQSGSVSNSLSLTEYFSGFWKTSAKSEFTTKVYANIDDKDLKLDIYSPPAGVEKKDAGVIVVHGGSWSGGERSDFPEWNRWLAENGYTVFDIDYRLAQPNWQTATGDVKCAVNWVRQNAGQFDISPQKIALFGRSAGGHLALLVAYAEDNSELPPSCASANRDRIRAVISFYAPTDLVWDYENPANRRVIDGPLVIRNLMGGNPTDSPEMKSKYLLASPTTHISSNSAPTLLIHGGRDQLVLPQNMNFIAEKLKENNVAHREIFISYAQHGFDYNFRGWGSQLIKPKILEFLNENLK